MSVPPSGKQLARLTKNERMTDPKHFQDVRLLEFEHVSSTTTEQAVEGQGLNYCPGDVLCLKPQNSDVDVERFLARMGWANDKHRVLTLASQDTSTFFPTLTSCKQERVALILKRYVAQAGKFRPTFLVVSPYSSSYGIIWTFALSLAHHFSMPSDGFPP